MKANRLLALLGGCLVGALLYSLSTAPVWAQGIVCKVAAPQLNLRSFPSPDPANIIALLPRNKAITVFAQIQNENQRWLRVSVDAGGVATNESAKNGFVAAQFVGECDLSVLASETPPAEQPPAPTKTATATRTIRFQPPLDRTGADPDAVSIAGSSGASPDGVDIFREFMIVKLDPSQLAAANDTEVRSVRFQIFDEDDTEVYKNTESSAPYCLFKNSGRQCDNIWEIEQTGARWPRDGGSPMRAGLRRIDPNMLYRVQIFAEYTDDNQDFWEVSLRVIPPNVPARDLYIRPLLGGMAGTLGFDAAEVRAQSNTLATADDGNFSFRNRLVFRLLVSQDSGRDGTGIQSVRFEIRDNETQSPVYVHTENNAPYCVFGNDESYCEKIWRFAETAFLWPASDAESGVADGIPILYDHTYEASMTVIDSDGNFGGEWNFIFDIVQDE